MRNFQNLRLFSEGIVKNNVFVKNPSDLQQLRASIKRPFEELNSYRDLCQQIVLSVEKYIVACGGLLNNLCKVTT